MAEGYLSIARHHYFVVAADAEHRRRADTLFHLKLPVYREPLSAFSGA
jgi:hypothetical protein